MLVTPHLAKPLAPGAARLPTDKWVAPNDSEMYLLGLDPGAAASRQRRLRPCSRPRKLPSGFGYQKLD